MVQKSSKSLSDAGRPQLHERALRDDPVTGIVAVEGHVDVALRVHLLPTTVHIMALFIHVLQRLPQTAGEHRLLRRERDQLLRDLRVGLGRRLQLRLVAQPRLRVDLTGFLAKVAMHRPLLIHLNHSSFHFTLHQRRLNQLAGLPQPTITGLVMSGHEFVEFVSVVVHGQADVVVQGRGHARVHRDLFGRIVELGHVLVLQSLFRVQSFHGVE